MENELVQYITNNSFAIFVAVFLLIQGRKDSERNNASLKSLEATNVELKGVITELTNLVRMTTIDRGDESK